MKSVAVAINGLFSSSSKSNITLKVYVKLDSRVTAILH